jgi:hypothetical protein
MLLPRKQITSGVLFNQLIIPVSVILLFWFRIEATNPPPPEITMIALVGIVLVMVSAFLWVSIYRDVQRPLRKLESLQSHDNAESLKYALRNGRRQILLLPLIGLYWEPDFYAEADALLKKATAVQHLAAASELISFGNEDSVMERIDEALATDPACKPVALEILNQLKDRLAARLDTAQTEQAFYGFACAQAGKARNEVFLSIATQKFHRTETTVNEIKCLFVSVRRKIHDINSD